MSFTPLLRAAPSASQGAQHARQMATLKEISMRLKSVKSIQKITKAMKMVSAAKCKRSEEALKGGRPVGVASKALLEKTELEPISDPTMLYIGISSDRGLCGGIHSAIAKAIKLDVAALTPGAEYKIVAVGDRARNILGRTHGTNFLLTANEVGRLPPNLDEASFIAQNILESGYEFDSAEIFYNHYRSVVSYKTTSMPVPAFAGVSGKPELDIFDEVEENDLKSYLEFTLATSIFYGQIESAASELSARMTAMENATSNAGEMIDNLQLTFNRTRQAVITRELIEIISGAAALE